MSVPYNPPSGQRTPEDLGDQTAETQELNVGHHESSYSDFRQHVFSGRQTNEVERGSRRIKQSEIEKLEARDEDNLSKSTSSTSEDGRIGRPSRPGPTHGLQAMRSVSMVRDGIESRHELELGEPLEKNPTPRHLADDNLVTWDVNDPDNPKTWSFGKKWAAVAIVSTFTFISPVSSSMTAPALNSIGAELNMQSEFEKELSLSIFILGEFPGCLLSEYQSADRLISSVRHRATRTRSIERALWPRHCPSMCQSLLSVLQPWLRAMSHKWRAHSLPVHGRLRRFSAPRYRRWCSLRPLYC